MATSKERQLITLVEVAKLEDAAALEPFPNNRRAEAGALRSHVSVGRAGASPALDTLTIPDVPGAAPMSSRVATIGRLRLRCLLRQVVVPAETYAVLTELADALAKWEEG